MPRMTRRLPSLNQLRAFEAAARHLSFKAGAEELCVTQAAVSHQIKALESALGVKLFHRGTRKVHLTPKAAEFAAALTEAFDAISTAADKIGETTMTGDLHLSVLPFFGNRWLVPRLQDFHETYPGLRVMPAMSLDFVDLSAGGADAGLRFGTGDWPGLDSLLIHGDRIGPVCAPGYLQGRETPLDPARLSDMALIDTRIGAQDWADWFRAAGMEPPVSGTRLEYENSAFAFDAALSGNGVCLADILLTAADEAAGNLVRLHPLTIPRPRGIYLVYTESARPEPRIRALGAWLLEQVRQSIGEIGHSGASM